MLGPSFKFVSSSGLIGEGWGYVLPPPELCNYVCFERLSAVGGSMGMRSFLH